MAEIISFEEAKKRLTMRFVSRHIWWARIQFKKKREIRGAGIHFENNQHDEFRTEPFYVEAKTQEQAKEKIYSLFRKFFPEGLNYLLVNEGILEKNPPYQVTVMKWGFQR